MNIQEARAWVASSAAQRYLQGIDEATDDALEASTRNIRSMSAFPSGLASEYRRAASTLERSQGAFNTEVNLIVQGRARDGRAVAQASRRYVADLVILEEMNTATVPLWMPAWRRWQRRLPSPTFVMPPR
jgi:hypothetical protein